MDTSSCVFDFQTRGKVCTIRLPWIEMKGGRRADQAAVLCYSRQQQRDVAGSHRQSLGLVRSQPGLESARPWMECPKTQFGVRQPAQRRPILASVREYVGNDPYRPAPASYAGKTEGRPYNKCELKVHEMARPTPRAPKRPVPMTQKSNRSVI
jgi:hypothetical protein